MDSAPAPIEPEPIHRELEQQHYEEPPSERRSGASWKIAIYVTTAAVIGATIVLAAAFTWNAFEVMPLPPPPKPTAAVKATVKAVEAPPAAAGLIASAGFNVAAQAPFKQGMGLLAQGDYAKAILAFDDSIRLDPSQPAAYGYRAFAHWNKGAADLAARDYTEAAPPRSQQSGVPAQSRHRLQQDRQTRGCGDRSERGDQRPAGKCGGAQ